MQEGEIRKVLIVDDEEDSRYFVRTVLKQEGWETHEAPGGTFAVEAALRIQPDLIVLDIQMPDRNGLEVLGDLRMEPLTAEIPVIMLTGIADQVGLHFSADELEDWVGEKPQAYLEKPVSAPELKRTVKKVIGEANIPKPVGP